MNDIEDRLRDAYRSATDTIQPGTIRCRSAHATVVIPSGRWWAKGALRRWIVPLTAAAAVLTVGVVAAVVVPQALRDARDEANKHGSGAFTPLSGNPATHFLTGVTPSSLTVHSAITGATVAALAPPAGRFFGPAATGDGITYVVAVTKPGNCGTWLYRFKISRTGQPSRLTPFIFRYMWSHEIKDLAVSRNGRTIAFAGPTCAVPGGTGNIAAGKAELGVLTIAVISPARYSGRGTYWSLPARSLVTSLALTADGRQLEYSTNLLRRFVSAIYLLPTSTNPGSGPQRSRMIFSAQGAYINSAVMAPDGSTIYFSSQASGGRWTLRAVSVSTGQSHVIVTRQGFTLHLVADPAVRELIAYGPGQAMPSGSPMPTSVPTPVPTGSPEPTPVPTISPGPTGSPVPTPAPSSGSPEPTPSRSPTPAPSRTPAPTAVPSATPTGVAATFDAVTAPWSSPLEVIRIQLPGGRITYLNPAPWDVSDIYYVW